MEGRRGLPLRVSLFWVMRPGRVRRVRESRVLPQAAPLSPTGPSATVEQLTHPFAGRNSCNRLAVRIDVGRTCAVFE